MQTPDTKAGAETEKIMADWLRRVERKGEGRPSTGVYNAAYEAVLSALDALLGKP